MSASGDVRTDAAAVRGVMSLDESEHPDTEFASAIQRAHTLVESRLSPHVNESDETVRSSLAWAETYAAAHYYYADNAGVGLGITDPDYGGAIVESASELDVTEEVTADHVVDGSWANGPNGIPSPYWTMATQFDPTPENYLADKQHEGRLFHTG